jgi:hypothetical protein
MLLESVQGSGTAATILFPAERVVWSAVSADAA